MAGWLRKCRSCGKGTNVEISEKKIVEGRVVTMIYCDRCPRASASKAPAILKGWRSGRVNPAPARGRRAASPDVLPGVRARDTERSRFLDSVDVPGRRVVYCGGYSLEHRRRVLEKKYGIDERYNIVSDDGMKVVADPR